MSRVLVYGATGSQAGPVAHTLLKNGHNVRVLTRHPERARKLSEAGAEIVSGDMGDAESLRRAHEGVDAVSLLIPFFTNAPGDGVRYGKQAVDAAQQAHVKLLVWNTSGEIPPARSGNPGFDLRLDVLEHLQHSHVPHVVVQPTAYMENLLGPWTRDELAEGDTFAYPTPKDVHMQWIATDDVAAFIVYALEHPELANLNVKVAGPERLNGVAVAERFSAALGRPIHFRPMPPEEFGSKLDEVFPGMGGAVTEGYKLAYAHPDMFSSHVDIDEALRQLPVPLTNLQAWVRAHSAAFSKTQEAADAV